MINSIVELKTTMGKYDVQVTKIDELGLFGNYRCINSGVVSELNPEGLFYWEQIKEIKTLEPTANKWFYHQDPTTGVYQIFRGLKYLATVEHEEYAEQLCAAANGII